jgi:hypothetical protein
MLPGYHQGPGMYCLPSSFTLVWICKAITNPFYLLYLLPYFKLPVLLPTWGLKQKKIEIRAPTISDYSIRHVHQGGQQSQIIQTFDLPHLRSAMYTIFKVLGKAYLHVLCTGCKM